MHCLLLTFTIASSITWATASPGVPCSIPSGIVQNQPLSSLLSSGWIPCYNVTYGTPTRISDFNPCGNTSSTFLFVGATDSRNGHSTILLGSAGPSQRLRRTQVSTTTATTVITNGGIRTFWYNLPRSSIGFSPVSSVTLNTCDTQRGSQRLCWHFSGGGGYRIGDIIGLNSDTRYFKLILTKRCSGSTTTPFPTPTTPPGRKSGILVLRSTLHPLLTSAISALGFSQTNVDAAQWQRMTTAQFAQYRGIVFGDPSCVSSTRPIDPAVPNRNTWGAAVTGNIGLYHLDESFHARPRVIRAGLKWITADPQATGFYMSFSCYYSSRSSQTVPVLGYFGSFTVSGSGSDNNIVVRPNTALGNLTGADISRWSTASHSFFNSYPASFFVVATTLGSPRRVIVLGRGSLATKRPTSFPTNMPTTSPTKAVIQYSPTDGAIHYSFKCPTPTYCLKYIRIAISGGTCFRPRLSAYTYMTDFKDRKHKLQILVNGGLLRNCDPRKSCATPGGGQDTRKRCFSTRSLDKIVGTNPTKLSIGVLQLGNFNASCTRPDGSYSWTDITFECSWGPSSVAGGGGFRTSPNKKIKGDIEHQP